MSRATDLSAEQNPYRPPDAEEHVDEHPILASAGRRLASTIICTGGIAWCLLSAAVFLQTLAGTHSRTDLIVIALLGSIGPAAFALGLSLFVITLILNVIALHTVRKYREQYD